MKLSFYLNGRENNLNLIRIIAALAVLVTHSFALFYGSGEAEPFRKSLGITIGSIAVDVFFLTSGFLVTASLLKKQNAIEFIWARFLRIYPGLIVMLFLTALIISPLVSTIDLQSYYSSKDLWIYMLKGMTILKGFSYNLPGVFESNPYEGAVNGSLWTLRYEVYMYALLVTLWLLLSPLKSLRVNVFTRFLCLSLICSAFYLISRLLSIQPNEAFEMHSKMPFISLLYMFTLGAVFYIFRHRVHLSYIVLVLAIALMLVSSQYKSIFLVVYLITLPFVLFTLAFVPKGVLRN